MLNGLTIFTDIIGSLPIIVVLLFIWYRIEKSKNPAVAQNIADEFQKLKTEFLAELRGIFGQHAATVAAAVAGPATPAPVASPAGLVLSEGAKPAVQTAAPSTAIAYVLTPLGPAAVAAPVNTEALVTETRDQIAMRVGPGITEDIAKIAASTGDQDVMRYAGDVVYRQVDTNFTESLTDSIKFVKQQRAGTTGNEVADPPLPSSGPTASKVGIFELLPPAEQARYYRDNSDLQPYFRTLFPNPSAYTKYGQGNQGSFNSAVWDGNRLRYVMPDSRFLGDWSDSELGIG